MNSPAPQDIETATDAPVPRTQLHSDVLKLGLVSFLTDVSSEMIFSVFAVFFTTVAGASSALLGLIEGMADFSASSLNYLAGWLSDRYDSRWLLFWYYGLRGLSLVWLPFSDFSFYALSIFAVFYGLDWVATVPPTVKLTAEHFGERSNIVFGWVFTGHQLGAASAAWSAGATRTAYETYLPAFLTAGLLCLAAALVIALFIGSSGLRRRTTPGGARAAA